MPVTAEQINRCLEQVPFTVRRLWIAYSGGVDSHALLHCCACQSTQLPEIAGAIHVNHGLSSNAGVWERHCKTTCDGLGIDLVISRISPSTGEGLEDQARRARYEAIASYLDPGDVVLLAQHQDDQAETFLLQALRGGGPRGTASMPVAGLLGNGAIARPLLQTSREAIMEYAELHQLDWIEDESNQDERFERNFLRRSVIPILKERWPAASKTLARSAAHTASLVSIAEELLLDELGGAVGSRENTLSISVLKRLPVAKSSLLIRALCEKQDLPMPATVHIEELLNRQLSADADRQILVSWPGAEFRRYQDDLYVQSPLPDIAGNEWQYHWDGLDSIEIPELHGRLKLRPSQGSGIRQSLVTNGLTVKPRSGGERCQPAGDNHHRELKVIFQNLHIPPWERERLPLIFQGDELLAIADLVISNQASVTSDETGYEVLWQRIE